MTAAKIATAIAFVNLFGYCNAQESRPLQPINNASAVVATQINSPTNYALLQPIATKPKTASSARAPISGMLKPIEDTSIDSEVATGAIVVLPHSFKRGVFDEHEFMVRNDGQKKLKNAKILLTAPAGSIVQRVVPKPDSVAGLDVELTIGELLPGEHQIVEVAIKYTRNELAHFKTKVTSTNWGNPVTNVAVETAAKPDAVPWPRSSGMLKPRVPATTVSTTTRRVVEKGLGRSGIGQSTSTMLEEGKSNTSKILKPLVLAVAHGVEVQPLPLETKEATMPPNTIAALLSGPSDVQIGGEVEFAIEVQNVSAEVANSVIVQLSVPEEMKVTILDRAAWYDKESKKLSWELTSLGGGVTETIRYRAVIQTGCSVEQNVVTGFDNKFQGQSAIRTTAN